MRTCPTHGRELVDRILWADGKRVGRVAYCPENGCGYQVQLPREQRQARRKPGQSAIDGGEA
ncbi:MAG: hypothetical protein LLG45_13135 [Actinomycetia bacterium]|nr:hypothetical protein [Actinomycetes bacterium]